jgi:hypothetical protein
VTPTFLGCVTTRGPVMAHAPAQRNTAPAMRPRGGEVVVVTV